MLACRSDSGWRVGFETKDVDIIVFLRAESGRPVSCIHLQCRLTILDDGIQISTIFYELNFDSARIGPICGMGFVRLCHVSSRIVGGRSGVLTGLKKTWKGFRRARNSYDSGEDEAMRGRARWWSVCSGGS